MKTRRQQLLNGFAVLSLVLAVYTGAAWASRLLPRYFEIPVDFSLLTMSQRQVSIRGGFNYVYFVDAHPVNPPIVGPDQPDAAARRAFESSFETTYFGSRALAFSIENAPTFSRSKDGTESMVGREKRISIGFGYFPLLFAALPAFLWLPPYFRRRGGHPPAICPTCGTALFK